MPICHFSEELCGPNILKLYRDIERVVDCYELWTAISTDQYGKLEDFIFENCYFKGEYSGAVFTFIIGQFHIIAKIGWDAWANAVYESVREKED